MILKGPRPKLDRGADGGSIDGLVQSI